jgi:uncharacterized protein (DUF305 family)
MTALTTRLGALALALVLSACGQGAKNDAESAAADSAETTTVDSGMAGMNGAAMPANMPQTPYTASETKMHQDMMQATGSDAQETYARKMIAHHQGALDMSRVVLDQNPDAGLRGIAEKTIRMQEQDIAELRRWVESRPAGAAATAPAG